MYTFRYVYRQTYMRVCVCICDYMLQDGQYIKFGIYFKLLFFIMGMPFTT